MWAITLLLLTHWPQTEVSHRMWAITLLLLTHWPPITLLLLTHWPQTVNHGVTGECLSCELVLQQVVFHHNHYIQLASNL